LHAFFLNASNALGLNKDLIGDGGQPKYAPCGTIVFSLLGKQGFAGGNNLLIFGGGFFYQVISILKTAQSGDSVTQSKVFSSNKTLNLKGRLFDLTTPKVMGILNVTPDSFYDGGRFTKEESILRQAEKMIKEGAAIIDIGAYSSRPGAIDIPAKEELKRMVMAVSAVHKKFPEIILSADTFRAEVAKAAVDEGASMINDISGGQDDNMFEAVALLKVPYLLMHMRGTPQTMTKLTQYNSLLKDIVDYFHAKIAKLHSLGVKDIIIDPGFGFAKTVEQNFQLLNHLHYFKILEKPILAGLSRKSFLWKTLGTNPDGALNGTTSANTIALLNGASLLRVHDVKEATDCIRLVSQLNISEINN
jgi:dihydropteroate synthase